jgi:hypothetical protein
MSETLSDWDERAGSSRFEEYAERYRDFFVMTRRDGILELHMYTDGGQFQHSWIGHNAWNRARLEVGNDPENEVLILTGTGDRWHSGNPAELWRTPFPEWSADSQIKMHGDMVKLLENLAFAVDIPTIAAVNGPEYHTAHQLWSMSMGRGGRMELLREMADRVADTPDEATS